jgi:DNA helicase-2/ATP-dependent DNA helicase PcrA
MRERVEALLPARGMWIGTFHGTCARILRSEIEVLGHWTRDFTIYDTADKNQLIKELLREAQYDTTRYRPAAISGWISDWKNSARGDAETVDETGMDGEVFAAIRDRYLERTRAANAVDFDDLQLLVLEVFDKHPGIRDLYASRFRHVLVDEYQDTNHVQYLLTRHLASGHGNLAVCGDPDQSIYAWRGADIRNIMSFEEDNPGAVVVRLEQNYRSSGNILIAAQGVISQNVERKEKDLWTDSGPGDPITVVECGDENDEAAEICQRIRTLHAGGRSLDDFAILYRVNFMQRALERALRMAGVQYQIVGGVEFYARKEIRDLLAYLRLVMNPADDVGFRRVVNVPPRGVGEKSLERLAQWAADRRVPLSRACASEEARSSIRGRAKKSLEAVAQLFERLEDAAKLPASEALERVLLETGYLDYLGQLADADSVNREENVDELRTHAELFDREHPDAGLRGFLEDIALVSDVDGFDEGQSAVTLMTMHAAKGLEFPVVFLAGLEEELMPHARAIEADDVEEERRLMYVGMTRAEQKLFLTWASTRWHFGEQSWRSASRFLEEIPQEVAEGVEADESDSEEAVLGAFEPASDAPGLEVGQWVEHAHFGRGLVERLQGSGVNARATVSFAGHGTKHLLLAYAKLDPVGPAR